MDTIKIDKRGTQMVAHAGLMGMEAANTLAGVIAAGNRSYWGIEVDARVTGDGEIVLIHNGNLKDVSGVDMEVGTHTLEELQRVTLYDHRHFYGMESYGITGATGEKRSDLRVPAIGEYIRLCKKYGKVAVVELKSEMTAENIAYIIRQFREQDYMEGVVFISFMWDSLEEVRRQAPECPVQYLTDEKTVFADEFLDKVAEAGFDLDIHIFTTTKKVVERIHARGIKVNVWTCDWPDRAAELVEWGVDYITSDILE